jgi:hypothetical protein
MSLERSFLLHRVSTCSKDLTEQSSSFWLQADGALVPSYQYCEQCIRSELEAIGADLRLP